ncbi:MAG: hypothetical protein M0Z75_12055 [Nitrospiraceae bacterium]|nr:hypothetical protein [Nitrospiraceae bacterium]
MEIGIGRSSGEKISGVFNSISSAADSLLGGFNDLGNAFESIESTGSFFQREDSFNARPSAALDTNSNAIRTLEPHVEQIEESVGPIKTSVSDIEDILTGSSNQTTHVGGSPVVPFESPGNVAGELPSAFESGATNFDSMIDGSGQAGASFMLNTAQGITDGTGMLQSAVQDSLGVIPACIDQTMDQANSLVTQGVDNFSASIAQGMESATQAVAQAGADISDTTGTMASSLDDAASSIDDSASLMDGGLDSISGAVASVDADFSSLDSDMNADWLTDASDIGAAWDGSGSYGGGRRRGIKRIGRSRSAAALSGLESGASSDIVSQYAQAAAGLAEAENPALEGEFGPEFAQSLQVQYQAQVNAYQDLLGLNTIGGGYGAGVDAEGGLTSGGVTIQISGITVNGAGNINGADDLASQIEDSIAQNIQRNASPITTALKEAGVTK